MKHVYILFTILALVFTSCHKNERQAEDSMEGKWNVVSVFSEYGVITTAGFAPDSSFSEAGALGTFNFSNSKVDYEFTANDSVYSASGVWNLEAEKVNGGFNRVLQFTLIIDNVLTYYVQFGDQTTNAEKDATSATLISVPHSGYGVQLTIQIEKI